MPRFFVAVFRNRVALLLRDLGWHPLKYILFSLPRWQWISRQRRNAKLPFVNSLLHLGFACFDGKDLLPDERELVPFYQQARALDAEEAARCLADLKPVACTSTVPNINYARRFNLTDHEVELMRAARHSGHEAPTKETTWATYCRQVLQPLRFYAFDAIRPRTIFNIYP